MLMKLSDTDFSLAEREMFSRIIGDDETLLWCGRPYGKFPTGRVVSVCIFALVWMAIPLTILFMSISEGDGSDPMNVMPVIFALIGLLLPAGVVLAHKRGQKARYALTDKRAILLQPGVFSGVRIFIYPIGPDMLLEHSRKKDGSGDLVFDYSDVRVNDKPLPRGFLKVENVEKPLSLLRDLGVNGGKEFIEF